LYGRAAQSRSTSALRAGTMGTAIAGNAATITKARG